ncbi:MAG: hypothetical protein OXU61_13390 [Gammaproteobacteria bacterium]|nr:hypothetical protein [Gammaproteobacteria bacterium]
MAAVVRICHVCYSSSIWRGRTSAGGHRGDNEIASLRLSPGAEGGLALSVFVRGPLQGFPLHATRSNRFHDFA